MDRLVFHNDRIAPLDEVRLSPGQSGLLMGWGVFTTARLYHGVPFAFECHWARMAHDAMRLGYEEQPVHQAIIDLARANRRGEGMARVVFVKNRGGLWAQTDGLPPTDLLVLTRELVARPTAHRLRL